MISRLRKVENDIYSLSSLEIIEINIQGFKVKEDEKEILFNHLLISKIIAQTALNLHNNIIYYGQFTQHTINILETLQDEEDRKEYMKLREALLDKRRCKESFWKKVFMPSVVLYMIVFTILQKIEECSITSDDSEDKVKVNSDYRDRSEDKNIEKEEENTLRSRTEMSKDHFDPVYNDQSADPWKCYFSDAMNDDKMMKCGVCEGMQTKHGGTSHTNNNVKLNMKEKEVKNYFVSTEGVTKESVEKDDNEDPDDVNYSVSTNKDFQLRNKSNIDSDLEDKVDLSKLNKGEVSHSEGHIQEEERSYDEEFRGVFVDGGYKHELELDNDRREVYLDKRRYISTTNITLTEDTLPRGTLTSILTVPNNDIPVLDRWTCGKCTMLNVYEDELCKACGECGPHRDKWRCGQCTMINDKLKKKCQACNEINPFIKRCDHCYVRNINYKYNKMCEECEGKSEEREKYYKGNEGKDRVDQWCCSKCSLLNSFDLLRCDACDNVGPHFNKWRCDKCTCFNDDRRSLCQACHYYKPGINNDHCRQTDVKDVNESHRNERLCRKCSKILADSEDQLCKICQRHYYTCPRYDCGEVVDIYKIECGYCYLKKNHNEGLSKGRLCSWRRCRHVNDEEDIYCRVCFSYRDESLLKVKCVHCGYIEYSRTKCSKCNRDFDKEIKDRDGYLKEDGKWLCSWRHCGYKNEPYRLYCYECDSYRDVSSNRIKCVHCGYIGGRDSKCYKCHTDPKF